MNSTTAHPPIESLPAASLTHDDARAIVDLLVQLWPRPEETLEDATERIKDQWRDYDGPEDHAPRYFCMREGDRMIALAHALPRTVGTADGQITVMGLARVCMGIEPMPKTREKRAFRHKAAQIPAHSMQILAPSTPIWRQWWRHGPN